MALSTMASRKMAPASFGSGLAGVCVHEIGQKPLVQGAPVHPDSYRFLILDRNPDDGLEVLVPPRGAHIPWIDAVLGQGLGRLRGIW